VIFRKEEEPFIKFVCTVPGYEQIEEIQPKPAKRFLPDWWKDMPLQTETSFTAKICPSMGDYFSSGYVIPMWIDSDLRGFKDQDIYSASSTNELPSWSAHRNSQLLDYTDASFLNQKTEYVFKANSPWKVITSPGYSVLQLPMFYEFNKDFTALPGIIDADTYHDLNIQLLSHSQQILIKRGTPLCVYVPFKRTKYNLKVSAQTKQEEERFKILQYDITSKFTGSGWYRSMQRKRDKKN
jgi:hypothetical protein